MTKLRIRLADWRDRESIIPLRRLLSRPVDGGLYELLNWPVYHCHAAVVDGKTVGFTAVALHLDGVADDVGTVVYPEFRNQGIGSELRATQVRDLELMGFGSLFCAASMSNQSAIQWCNDIMGLPVGQIESAYLDPHLYYGSSLDNIKFNLKSLGVREPFPLSDVNVERLLLKFQRAVRDASQIQALGDFNMRKAMLRQDL